MRIAIDARMMGPLNTRGIGRYTEELIRGLIPLLEPSDSLILLVKDPSHCIFQGNPRVEIHQANAHWYSFKEQLFMPWILSQVKADVVHIPHWNVPLLYRGPLVLTVHDLLLLHPEAEKSAKISTKHPFIFWMKRLGYRLTLWHAMRQAKVVFVPTEYVAKDINRFYPDATIPRVTSEGLPQLPVAYHQSLSYESFLFYVGSAYPHKRLDLILEAWPILADRYPHLHLVLGGELDVFMKRHQHTAAKKNLPRVHFPGRLSDEQLANHYSQATAFLFPSANEGFGLPPLEALSYGCPVVSSDSTSLPEVLPREGVFFFQNGDVNGMIRAIDQILEHPSEAREAVQRSLSDLRLRYDWKKVAEKTLSGYRSIKV